MDALKSQNKEGVAVLNFEVTNLSPLLEIVAELEAMHDRCLQLASKIKDITHKLNPDIAVAV